MARIKLNLRNLPVPQKIAKARQIVAALTGNFAFPTPTPPLATVTTIINDTDAAFAAAETAKQESKTRTSDLHAKEDLLDKTMTQVAAYVEAVAGADERLIRSAGMDARATAVASSDRPAVPISLNITGGDADAEIDLTWEPVANAKSYQIEQSLDPPTATSWAHAGISTKSKFTGQRPDQRHTLLVPRCRRERERSKRLERSSDKDRALIFTAAIRFC